MVIPGARKRMGSHLTHSTMHDRYYELMTVFRVRRTHRSAATTSCLGAKSALPAELRGGRHAAGTHGFHAMDLSASARSR